MNITGKNITKVLILTGMLVQTLFSNAQGAAISNKEKAVALLNSIASGDAKPAQDYINPDKYIQHNLNVGNGVEGFNGLLKLPKGSIKVQVVRAFEDGEYVFTHTDYDFFGPKIGFDIFRFEKGKIVEHWDNLQTTAAANPSGRSMIDGTTTINKSEKTKASKALVKAFVQDILADKKMEKFAGYFQGDKYIQHNPNVADTPAGLLAVLDNLAKQGIVLQYTKIHKVLGEGDFVLVVSEGSFAGAPSSFYDLFRVENGKIAEHWDTVETIPPRAEWKNDNGKF